MQIGSFLIGFSFLKSSHTVAATFSHLPRARFDYILTIEYSYISMQNLLRSYKASIFQALGHPTRIAIVEMLRVGELTAGVIQERLGIEQANVSQHLSILRSRQIVTNRKEGNQVFYSLRNPVLMEVLDIMRRYFQANLKDAVQMLDEIKAERRAR
jgi:DNA-binding transcriptional ArsR family regulator